jgi:hypothetical protein
LRVTPHQIQILSLYVVLMSVAPLMIWLLHRRWFLAFFGLTWAVYAVGWFLPPDTLLLGMQFEYAFPPLMYQLLFAHALAVGFFRREIAARLEDADTRRAVLSATLVLCFAFFLFAQMTPNHTIPTWSRLEVMSAERWQAIYDVWFDKTHPSPLRLLNVAVLLAAFYALLTYFWQPIHRALGWLLIPLGEASLYVFLMHLVFIVLIDQLPGYFDVIPDWHDVWPGRIWINTALYAGTILGLWALVRNRVLFGVVPR